MYKLWYSMLVITLATTCSANFTTVVAESESENTLYCDSQRHAVGSVVNYVSSFLSRQIGEFGNYFFSPFSVSVLLGMVYLGAHENTAMQMEDALRYRAIGLSSQQVHEGFRELCESILQNTAEGEYKLLISNALFPQIGEDVRLDYIERIQSFYHGSLEPLDFSNNSQSAMEYINLWTRNQTSGKISKILDEPLPLSTSMALINAIYFKGTWKIQFPINKTYNGYFYVSEEVHKIVPMMTLVEEKFRYFKDAHSGYKFLELPYRGNEVSMLLALPVKYNEPATLIMDSELLCRVNASLVETKMDVVSIPKFRLEFDRNLQEDLQNAGIQDAFVPEIADFSGIRPDIYLSNVFHKAVIEVNEEGSEAAAVTRAIFMPVSLREVPEFIANHPFLFYIIDISSGVILFSGRIEDP